MEKPSDEVTKIADKYSGIVTLLSTIQSSIQSLAGTLSVLGRELQDFQQMFTDLLTKYEKLKKVSKSGESKEVKNTK